MFELYSSGNCDLWGIKKWMLPYRITEFGGSTELTQIEYSPVWIVVRHKQRLPYVKGGNAECTQQMQMVVLFSDTKFKNFFKFPNKYYNPIIIE